MEFRRIILLTAFFSGFLCVALGAFGAHALKDTLTPALMESWKTAVLYQMFHTVVLIALSGLRKFPVIPVYLFLTGITLFSGSLYLYCLTGIHWMVMLTPVGGIALLAAWAGLFIEFWRES